MALNKEDFARNALERIKVANKFWDNWRTTAVDDYGFVSGNGQWTEEDTAKLNAEHRPTVTFNYSEKMIDAVVGAEVSNRQEATYKPRGVEDGPMSELMNNAAKWVRDECAAEDEESDAFRDMLICGLGWTHTRLSYEEDQDGKLIIERIDPLEMRSDPAATKPGLTDRRYAYRDYWADEGSAKREWPSAIFSQDLDSNSANTGIITRGHRYMHGETEDADQHRGQVPITLYECVESEPIYRIVLAGKIQEMSVSEFGKVKDMLDQAEIQYIKQSKRVFYQGFFSGETLLEMTLSPSQEGFTFQAITGKRDRNKNTWYGLTRVMKDPQRWANKWLSQILHIVNSNAKGGLMAEINAFVDPVKAQEEWAQPDSITLFNEGALSGNKVKEKTMGAFPAGLDKLMQFALGSLPMVTGINLEALGLANREQAGVLEQQRKQAAYGLLAPLFDSLRRYRKFNGRVLSYMIRTYISDGRMIRIAGAEAEQYIPLLKQPDGIRYDIIVDQSPNAPDVKERTWQTLESLVPAMLKAGMPVPPDLLDYAPLPVALATKWKKFAAQQGQPDPAMQQQMQQLQQQLQQLTEENKQLKSDISAEQMALQQKEQQIMAELMLKKTSQEAEIALKHQAAQAEYNLANEKQNQLLELERRKADQALMLAQEKADNDARIAEIAARNKPTPSGA